MALKKDFEYKDIAVKDAYIAVFWPTVSGDKLRLGFNLQYRVSADSEEALTDNYYSTSYDLSGGNDFIQAYNYLKTLPEFQGAEDC